VLGEIVRAGRRRLGLTQEELAAKAGINVRTIGKLEANLISNPRPATLRLLADALALHGDDRDRFLTAATARLPARPGQLPADVAAFTGRADQVRELTALVEGRQTGQPGPVSITVLTGTAGVGKTALAVHWAHRIRHLFDDGQLYANLQGFAPGKPLRPLQVLAQFLGALGVPSDQVPVDEAEAASLYRSLLAGRRALLLLDNARDADQVRPLLPGDPGCLVVVTSRDALTGLVARDGARLLTVEVLPQPDSEHLLARLLGAERVGAEPAAAAELARLCGGLPLALRIAAANLTSRRHRGIAGYANQLRGGDRLATLAVDGDEQTAVRAAFDQSFATLPDELRRLFRLLSVISGPDFTVPVAAELIGQPPEHAARLLDRLAGAHLVEEHVPGRYHYHDLLRLYARELVGDDEGAAAVRRLFDWYLRHCDAAAALLYPQILRLRDPEGPPVVFDQPAAALAWLDAERLNLVAATVQAATHGPHELACLLADVLKGYFWVRSNSVDWQVVGEAARIAADHTGDLRAQTAAQLSLGLAQLFGCRYRDALRHFDEARVTARRVGWRVAEASAFGYLGLTSTELEDLPRAMDALRRSLAMNEELGPRDRRATSLNNLARVFYLTGQLRLAEEHFAQALALGEEADATSTAIRLTTLGTVRLELGELDRAFDHLTHAVGLTVQSGHTLNEAWARIGLAQVHRDAGRLAEALDEARRALDLAGRTGHRDATCVANHTLATIGIQARRYQEAAAHAGRALELAHSTGYRRSQALVSTTLADAYRELGDLDRAMAYAREAVDTARELGYRVVEGLALVALAETCQRAGLSDDATTHARQALDLLGEAGHRVGEERARATLTS